MKYKLSEIGRVVTGKTPSTKNKTSFSEEPNQYFFVTPRDMNVPEKTIQKTERYLTDEVTNTFKNLILDNKSICVSCIGTIGKVFMPSGPTITNQQINSITEIKNFILPDYLYYYLTIHQKDIGNLAGGTTMPIVNKASFEQLEVEVPDLDTQQKIVRILSVLDQKIELNNKQNQNLSNIIKTLFKNTLNGLNGTVKLGEISKISSGKRPYSLNEKDKYEVVGARNVMGYTNTYNQEAETIITGRVGTLGVIKRYARKTWASDNTLVIDTEFKNCIECFLSSIDFDSYNRGSTQPLITQTDLKNLIIPFEKERYLAVEQKMAPLRSRIFNNQLENEQLALLRDTLLPELLSGSINLDSI